MTYSFDGYNYLIRLEKGEHLNAALEQFVAETRLDGAWLSGLGAAQEIVLGFFTLSSKEYKWRTFSGMHEIAALQGNVALDDQGKVVFHIHGAFSDDEYQTVGGHVQDFVAGATVELFVHRAYQPMHRAFDDETGLQLLQLKG